jgi:uncharacterized tellurite resistance protein B-like protein
MEETKLNLKQFYKELGQLLYSVAYADGKVRKQEVEALKDFVLKELAPAENSTDASGMNQAFYAQFEFEQLEEKHQPPHLVFLQFLNYLRSHLTLMSDFQKQSIVKAVKRVADAYKKTNKQEQEVIDIIMQEVEGS